MQTRTMATKIRRTCISLIDGRMCCICLLHLQYFTIFKAGEVRLEVMCGYQQMISRGSYGDVMEHGFVIRRQVGKRTQALPQGLSQATPATDDQEVLAFYFVVLKVVRVTRKEQMTLFRLEAGWHKTLLYVFGWRHYPAVGKGRVMTTDNNMLYGRIGIQDFKCCVVPLLLLAVFFTG